MGVSIRSAAACDVKPSSVSPLNGYYCVWSHPDIFTAQSQSPLSFNKVINLTERCIYWRSRALSANWGSELFLPPIISRVRFCQCSSIIFFQISRLWLDCAQRTSHIQMALILSPSLLAGGFLQSRVNGEPERVFEICYLCSVQWKSLV